MKSLQRTDGYWWFTLEANESIGAEFIFLMHYLGAVDEKILKGIAQRILDVQRDDGTWGLYNDAEPELSTTVECYFALKLAGIDISSPNMLRARDFILKNGGIEKTRVFTRIHLAMFGLIPWESAAAMPAEFMLLPSWFPVSIYEFATWARATIVPLLIFMSVRKTVKLKPSMTIDELFANPIEARDYSFATEKSFWSPENFFIIVDNVLKYLEKIPLKPLRKLALNKCSRWTWDHVKRTEDIYPALAYAAFAFKALGYDNDSPQIKKPFEALKMFQQYYASLDVEAMPPEIRDDGQTRPSQLRQLGINPFMEEAGGRRQEELVGRGTLDVGREMAKTEERITPDLTTSRSHDLTRIHQQCCISPVWDTPWMLTALLDAGVPSDDPALLKSGKWLLSKQITDIRGDWAIKNKKARPGGWAFEFENDFFPDVDDTIQVVSVLQRLPLPEREKITAIRLGTDWILSMQNRDGGWGAFDKNQHLELANRIPFSDHAACLDPSSPDITGRAIELLAGSVIAKVECDKAIQSALSYIFKTQETFGGWFARWGINYIYGTWCVLTGLSKLSWDMSEPRIKNAVSWLESIQHADGGFGESPASYIKKAYIPWKRSVPSQTAWGLMALVAAGRARNDSAKRAAEFLLKNRNENGSWNEKDYTGTGFPGHFYIRYHGYRHFFPLLALARYFQSK